MTESVIINLFSYWFKYFCRPSSWGMMSELVIRKIGFWVTYSLSIVDSTDFRFSKRPEESWRLHLRVFYA